jgi:hypothetical protein
MRFLLTVLLVSGLALGDQIEREATSVAPAPDAVMVKVDPATKTVTLYAVPQLDESVRSNHGALEKMAPVIEATAMKVGELKLANSELEREGSTPAWWGRWRGGWGWNNWCGYRGGYNWYRPYYYPGYINYYSNYYNYGYGYGYNNCNYGYYW